MFSNPDFPAHRSGLLALLAVAVLAACSTSPSSKNAEIAAGRVTAPSAVVADGTATSPATDGVLAYADRVRLMPPAELAQEVARLGEASTPAGQMQLSLVLSQLHQLPELRRAQELLARVLGNASAEAQALHPLARLLAARYGEQRRLEEQLEKQIQQTRDVQRRLDQTNEKLDALKAIERSMTSRPPAAGSSSAPAGRTLRPAP